MIYSSACEYAIRAATHLALHPPGVRITAGHISRTEKIPSPYLSSVLHRLVTAGLLASTRGPAGGYSLTRPPESITLYQIKEAVDGLRTLDTCAVGLGRCSDDTPCPLHDSWKPIREEIRTYLNETTLEDMAQAISSKESMARAD